MDRFASSAIRLMFSFAHLWIFLFLPAPFLVWWFFPPRPANQVSVRVPFGERLSQTAGPAQGARRPRRFLVPALIWILLIAALARPQWLEPPVTKNQPTRDLLLLVDLSSSMSQDDFANASGQKVDRLTAAKEVLGDFLSKREGDRVGLVVFGDAPYLQAPFSTDLGLSRELLDETAVGMAGPRTAFGDAIGLGINLFGESKAPAKTIIALTDGNDTASQVPPVEAARVAAQRGIRLHTVAIGDPTTVGEDKLDTETLQRAAQTTGGKYYFAQDRKALTDIYDELDRIETRKIEVVSHRPRIDLFPWAVLAALAVGMIEKLIVMASQTRGAGRPAAGSVRVHPVTGKLEVSA